MISIIIGFRDREMRQVKLALTALESQSYTDFEVIFLDYGSSDYYAKPLMDIVSNFNFVRYYYSFTQGLFWNRAHALNTGVRFAKGEIIIFYDIDIIAERTFLEKVSRLDFNNNFFTFSCFYLPEHFDLKSELSKNGIHHEQNYVGVCAVAQKEVINIKCFDEFYLVWGVEDDDFYQRLEKVNLERVQKMAGEFQLFHQWHESHSPKLPSMWYLTMVEHLFSSLENKNFSNERGKLFTELDRPLLKDILNKSFNNFIHLDFTPNSSFYVFNSFVQGFHKLKRNEKAYLNYSYIETPKVKQAFSFFKNKTVDNTTVSIIQKQTIKEFFQFFIGTHRHLMLDYYYRESQNNFLFVVIKNE